MSYVTLELARSHLAVIHTEDDTLIQQCIDAAESYAASFMDRPRIEDDPLTPWLTSAEDLTADTTTTSSSSSSSSSDLVPAAVVQAILLYVGDFYHNRVAGESFRNLAAESLLHFHRVGLGI